MRQGLLILLLGIISSISFAQNTFTISGYIVDESSGESVIGASIYDEKDVSLGTSSNVYGFFSLTIPAGEHTIIIKSLGFSDIVKEVNLSENLVLDFEMAAGAVELSEVKITEKAPDENTKSTKMSTIELETNKIKELPALMGEVDVLKTLQLLPGVQSAGEGNSGFYVRGGGPDQNLILLDGAVVYNAAHLFGFFSVFNADAVKDIELIKGGMPAQYGGRLSSVLNINMKEGNKKKLHADGGIGIISSRLTIEGPIKKDTSSFIISARRTYIDVLMKPFTKNNESLSGTGYYFYDLNTKFNYIFSPKDRIFVSGYFGRDVFNFASPGSDFNISIPWGNATGSLRWNHLFSEKLFLNTSLIYSDYQFEFGAVQEGFEFKLFSGITDWNLKADMSYFPNPKHSMKWGINTTYHIFTPNNLTAKVGEVDLSPDEIMKQQGLEEGIYFQDEWEINTRLKANLGLRYSFYENVGPFDRFVKNDANVVIDTISYGTLEHINFYHGLEPRASFRYKLDEHSSVKASFSMNNQYVHMATLSGSSLPTDVWVPSSELVQPQKAIQYATGYFRNFLDDTYETSVEVYYKDMKNMIEYEEGATPESGVNDNPDNYFTYGQGWSYGVELFLKKRTGDFTGWIGYTWSKTERLFDEINAGNIYPAKYDRRHDISVVGAYEINKRMTLAATFVYATGNAITIPLGTYIVDGNFNNQYGERNGYRIQPYHRADLSLTVKGKESKKFKSSWNFSIYNVYNRKNVYFINFTTNGSLYDLPMQSIAEMVSLFPVLPSVTWNFSF